MVGAGRVLALLGRNGMGKTTTVRTIMGLMRPAGRITFGGRDMRGLAPHRIAWLGLGLVPEGRRVFRNLTVTETLVATARPPTPAAPGEPWTLARVMPCFRVWPNATPAWADSCPAANNRCWPSAGR